MKEQALQIAEAATTDRERRNLLREYLQHVLLRQLFERDLLDELIFHGGTALRIIHDLPRFSEDLDFHTKEVSGFDLGEHLEDLQLGLEQSGYSLSLKPSLQRNVQSCMFRFEELLQECGLAGDPRQELNIKLEINTNPLASSKSERAPIDQYLPFVVLHHDRSSFISGKLHAIHQRNYAKGRDYFDLMFFLQRWRDVAPNIEYLANALEQTGYEGPTIAAENWKQLTVSRIREVDWSGIQRDVVPFLLRPADSKMLDGELLVGLLGSD